MMHDGQVIVEGTPDEIRRTSSCTTSTSGAPHYGETGDEPLLEVAGLNAYYGSAHALQDVTFSHGPAIRGHRRTERDGEDDALRCDHGLRPAPTSRFDRFDGVSSREAVLQDRTRRNRLRAPRATAVPVAHRPRASKIAYASDHERRVDHRPGLRPLSPARRAASATVARSCREGNSRCWRSGGRSSATRGS